MVRQNGAITSKIEVGGNYKCGSVRGLVCGNLAATDNLATRKLARGQARLQAGREIDKFIKPLVNRKRKIY
ncbi:MAG: hypothetical protein AUG51_06670 [Acidobacteria bacterium 13_1_20CM_3_53_8]|nr:MAG: hypothetical protein AUG51_06670 [Acidobacteria bacterium 13_1_20CM_3_53_8]